MMRLLRVALYAILAPLTACATSAVRDYDGVVGFRVLEKTTQGPRIEYTLPLQSAENGRVEQGLRRGCARLLGLPEDAVILGDLRSRDHQEALPMVLMLPNAPQHMSGAASGAAAVNPIVQGASQQVTDHRMTPVRTVTALCSALR